MNKKLTLAAIAGAAAMSFGQIASSFLWDGSIDTEGRVDTGSEEKTAGYWYEYNDANDGGSSAFTFPSDVEENTYGNFYGPLVEAYGGIKASITLGDGYDYPYAGLGFNIVSENQEGADISAWSGICLTYTSTIGFGIELGVEDEKNVTAYDNYKAAVSKAPSGASQDYAWAKFKQGGWGTEVDQATVLAKTAAIKLKFEGTAGTSGDFNICQVGSLGKCGGSCSAGGSAIKAIAAAGSAKAMLSGRTVMFSGFTSAKAEVINLQGQVVKSAVVSSSMDLSSLDAGVYMLRVAGKSVKLAQKIVLE
jgi:hypothetical protein